MKLPAIRALLIQVCAFALTLLLVWGAARIGLVPNFAAAALLQGTLAAAISWRLGLPSWWLPIQFLFPILVLSADSLALPSWIYLAAFVFLLALYWSTFRTRVPYYPSGRRATDVFASLLPAGRALKVIDIGSGMGGVPLALAHRYHLWEVSGIELAPLPWLISRVRAFGARARFLRGDYADLDLGQYDAVFAYLSPAAMPALWDKARREMRPGSILASYAFDVPGHPPTRTENVNPEGPHLYIWDF